MHAAATALARTTTTAPSAAAEPGAGASIQRRALRGASYAEQVQMLAPDAGERAEGGAGESAPPPPPVGASRVSGDGAAAIVALMGEPPWAVRSTKEGKTPDAMRVLKVETRSDGKAPSWYLGEGEARNIGHLKRGQGYVMGGWHVLGGQNGVYHGAYVDEATGVGTYFIVDYAAPREKSRTEYMQDMLRAEGGGLTPQYGAYRAQQVLYGVVSFFNPADNLIQGATGRNLNVFDDDFGKKLSGGERTLQFLQAGAEMLGAKGLPDLSKAERVALAVACAFDAGGEAVIGSLVDVKMLDASTAEYARVVVKLGGLAGSFGKWHAGKNLELVDYLGTVSALVAGGDQAVKAMLGEAGYEAWWEPNFGTISKYVQGIDKLGAIVDELAKLGH